MRRPLSTRLFAALGAVVTAGALILTAGVTANAETNTGAPKIDDLGVAMRTVNVRAARTGVQPDGTPVIYAFSDGQPVSFNVINARTGALIHTVAMPPYTVAASIVVHPDRTVYFSVRSPNDGSLFRYHPGTHQLDTVASGVIGEQMLRTLVVDEVSGVIYGSTYPNAKVFSYNPATAQFHDYGRMTTDGAYAWGFELANGKLWVGTGAVPHMFSLDPLTGEKVEIALPPGASTLDYITRIVHRNNMLLVRFRPALPDGRNVAAFDLTTNTWCCNDALTYPVGLETETEADGTFYYPVGRVLYEFDPATGTSKPTSWANSPVADAMPDTVNVETIDLGLPEFPGTSVIGMRTDGTFWRFNPATGHGDIVANEVSGAPVTVHSLGTGPDGKVYVGAYLSAGVMARVTRGGTIEQLVGPSQADTILAHQGRIVIGTYPDAVVYAGDARNWNWGTNPSELFSLPRTAPYHQDRPVTLVSAGRRFAVGTVPNYGELGGALTLSDLDGNIEFHRNVVPDQSVVSLAYVSGLIIGGTSIHGGLSTSPTQTEAQVFVWDVASGRKLWSGIPVAGAEVVNHLTVTPDGTVWGLTNTGTVFQFNPYTRQVTRSAALGLADNNIWGLGSTMFYRPADGHIYGNAGGKLFRINRRTMTATVLTTGVSYSAMDGDQAIYFANRTNIFRYRL